MDHRRTTGETGEKAARNYVSSLGFNLLDQNYRTRNGELDLVYLDRETLAFCEVKPRLSRAKHLHPALELAVGPAKQRKIRQMAAVWLADNGASTHRRASKGSNLTTSMRFDFIGVSLNSKGYVKNIKLIRDAF